MSLKRGEIVHFVGQGRMSITGWGNDILKRTEAGRNAAKKLSGDGRK